LQTVRGDPADALARSTGFIQRQRKWTGPTFAQALVFGWLAKPDASLDHLTQMAAHLGVTISPQALDERFTPQAADFLHQLLGAGVQEMIAAEPAAIPLLNRFTAVDLIDSSTIPRPEPLAATWAGCGGRDPGSAMPPSSSPSPGT
jgi:hypothetical protein